MGILQKSLLLEALEIVTCDWGGWVSKEDVSISKYLPSGAGGKKMERKKNNEVYSGH